MACGPGDDDGGLDGSDLPVAGVPAVVDVQGFAFELPEPADAEGECSPPGERRLNSSDPMTVTNTRPAASVEIGIFSDM